MKDLINKIIDLIFEGSSDLMPNKKIGKSLKVVMILIPITIMIAIIIGGIVTLRTSIFAGSIIIIAGIILFVKTINIIKNHIKKYNKEKNT